MCQYRRSFMESARIPFIVRLSLSALSDFSKNRRPTEASLFIVRLGFFFMQYSERYLLYFLSLGLDGTDSWARAQPMTSWPTLLFCIFCADYDTIHNSKQPTELMRYIYTFNVFSFHFGWTLLVTWSIWHKTPTCPTCIHAYSQFDTRFLLLLR